MITVNTPANFLPWPDDMPDGFAYVGDAASIIERDESIIIWRNLPSNLTDTFNVPLPSKRANGSSGKPVLMSGPFDIINQITPLITGAIGLYMFDRGVWIGDSWALAHEWGHLMDFEYSTRTGGSGTPLQADATISNLYAIIQPSLGAGVYAKTNASEFFAEFFKGWVTQDRFVQVYATEPTAGEYGRYDYFGTSIMAMRARFATLLPFEGMDLWRPYNTVGGSFGVYVGARGHIFMLHIDPQANPAITSIRWELSTDLGNTYVTQPGMTGKTYEYAFPADTQITNVIYRAYASNSLGEVSMAWFIMNISTALRAPTVYLNTQGLITGVAGTSVSMSAAAHGNPEPTIQWQVFNSTTGTYENISGETSRTLTVTIPLEQVDRYRPLFSNSMGSTSGISCEVREPTTLPGLVTGLVAGIATESALPISWLAKYGATGYRVEYKLSSATNWTTFASNHGTTSIVINGLASSSTYDVRVAALNAAGVGGTTSISVSTLAPASGTLLVDVTGVSAAAAYGLRRLRSVYAGAAIRVRRLSDFAELDIGFVGNDLDSVAIDTFRLANNAEGEALYVMRWYDQSSNAVDLLPGRLPNFGFTDYARLSIINGKPAIDFTEVGGLAVLSRASFGLYAAGATTVAIAMNNGFSSGYIVNEASTSASNPTRTYQMMSLSSGNWQVRAVNNTPTNMWNQTSGNLSNSADHVGIYTDSGSVINTWIDGAQNHTNTSATRSGTLEPDTFNVGGLINSSSSNFYRGLVYELVIWKSELNSTRRLAVESDQMTHFGIN